MYFLFKSTVKLMVRYENGEEGCVQISKVEPNDEDFESPKEGDEVCCKAGAWNTLQRYNTTSAHQQFNFSCQTGIKVVLHVHN